MNIKKYRQLRAGIVIFIGVIVSIVTMQNSYLLALAAVITGMLFLIAVRNRTIIRIDEREKTIREKSA